MVPDGYQGTSHCVCILSQQRRRIKWHMLSLFNQSSQKSIQHWPEISHVNAPTHKGGWGDVLLRNKKRVHIGDNWQLPYPSCIRYSDYSCCKPLAYVLQILCLDSSKRKPLFRVGWISGAQSWLIIFMSTQSPFLLFFSPSSILPSPLTFPSLLETPI